MKTTTLKLNTLEAGYLIGCLAKAEMMERMEKEMPELFMKIMILSIEPYASSDGHPLQKQAKKDLKLLKGKLKLSKLNKNMKQFI